jgi:ribosome biogenesis GTPase
MLELNIKHTELKDYYPEFAPYTCKFTNCTHTNEQTCNVKLAAENGEINKDRYLRYTEMFKQLKTKWEKEYD